MGSAFGLYSKQHASVSATSDDKAAQRLADEATEPGRKRVNTSAGETHVDAPRVS